MSYKITPSPYPVNTIATFPQPASNQSNNIPLPMPPPPYSAPPPVGRSMNEMKVIWSNVDVNKLSPEQTRRRSFYLQLINTLTNRLTSFVVDNPNGDCCTWNEHIWDVFGYRYRHHCCKSYTVPEGNPEKFKRFATRITLGLSYVYQYIIPLLDADNNQRLANYFAHSFTLISSSISSYSILMSTIYQDSPDPKSNVCDLKTDKGFAFSFNHILSMGLQTIEGDLYEPTNQKNVLLFNQLKQNGIWPYRLGTIEVITLDLLSKFNDKKRERASNSIDLQPVQGALSINIDEEINKAIKFKGDIVPPNALAEKTIFNQFWENVDNFACKYLTNEELQSYKKFSSFEICQDFLLAPEVYRADDGRR